MARSSVRRPAIVAEVDINQLFVGFEMSNAKDVARMVILSRFATRKLRVTNDRVIQPNPSDTSRQMLVMQILTLFSFQFI